MLNAAGEQTQDSEMKRKKRREMNKARARTPRVRLNKQKGPFVNPRAIPDGIPFFYVRSGGRHIRSKAPEEENYYFNVPNRFVIV